MKKIHFSLIILLTSMALFTFSSCGDDDYSPGNFIISLATVNLTDELANGYYLTTDNGERLCPVATNVDYKPKSNQRVLVDYTLLDDSTKTYDYLIRVNRIQNIITKKVIDMTAENESEIGNDPVKILDYWIGDNYLNIHFGYNVGGEKTHKINLVRNRTLNSGANDLNDQNLQVVNLEFRHNADGDPERYGAKSYAAFDLREFQTEGEGSVEFLIKSKDLNNEEKEYKLIYKYNISDNNTTNKIFTNMPDDVILD